MYVKLLVVSMLSAHLSIRFDNNKNIATFGVLSFPFQVTAVDFFGDNTNTL